MRYEGKPRFALLDDGDTRCLPVVTAMLNPECGFTYDDIDMPRVLSQSPSVAAWPWLPALFDITSSPGRCAKRQRFFPMRNQWRQ